MNEQDIVHALSVLGLRPGANEEDCHQAWRALSRQHHPDLHAAGSPDHAKAVERQTAVNAAYELIKKADLSTLPLSAYDVRPAPVANPDTWDQIFEKARAREKSGEVIEAMEQYRKLAHQGYTKAQFRLGYIYFDSIMKDLPQAYYWWKRAAEQGHPAAQFNLGLMYERGLGMPVDPQQAMHWFMEAAKLGDSQAKAKLGRAMNPASASSKGTNGLGMPTATAAPKSVVEKEDMTNFIGKKRASEDAGRAFVKKIK
jgi:TPR repeat protein